MDATPATSAYCRRQHTEQLIPGVSDKKLELDLPSIGDRIRQLREHRELSQEALARAVHAKSSSDVSRWERGLVAPRAENLLRLADALGVSVDYLLGGETASSNGASEALKTFLETPIGQEAVKRGWTSQLRRLSPPKGVEVEQYRHLVLALLDKEHVGKKPT